MSSSITRQPTALEVRLGWTFRDLALYTQALTHSTYANENPTIAAGSNYERLEFLGDAVLDLIAARLLCEHLPNAPEGELSRRRARLVCRDTLVWLARKLDVGQDVLLGEGQKRAAAEVGDRILADVYEALAGAVYLDGGYAAAEACFAAAIAEAIVHTEQVVDFKTQLQELCHQQGWSSPQYNVVGVDGPPHARIFTCEVTVGDNVCGRGDGSSKKAAEQVCAEAALMHLG